jgi:hypothetical protein
MKGHSGVCLLGWSALLCFVEGGRLLKGKGDGIKVQVFPCLFIVGFRGQQDSLLSCRVFGLAYNHSLGQGIPYTLGVGGKGMVSQVRLVFGFGLGLAASTLCL